MLPGVTRGSIPSALGIRPLPRRSTRRRSETLPVGPSPALPVPPRSQPVYPVDQDLSDRDQRQSDRALCQLDQLPGTPGRLPVYRQLDRGLLSGSRLVREQVSHGVKSRVDPKRFDWSLQRRVLVGNLHTSEKFDRAYGEQGKRGDK